MSNGVTPYNYTSIDEVVARIIAMTDGERRQVAAKLAQQAPYVAGYLVDQLLRDDFDNPPMTMPNGGPPLDFAE